MRAPISLKFNVECRVRALCVIRPQFDLPCELDFQKKLHALESSRQGLSNAVCRLSLRCVVLEISGGGAKWPLPKASVARQTPTGRGLIVRKHCKPVIPADKLKLIIYYRNPTTRSLLMENNPSRDTSLLKQYNVITERAKRA